jgi:branched-chain amino acid transport system substrate-binding protein
MPSALHPRRFLLTLAASLLAAAAFAQVPPAVPYATIDRDAVSYSGPGRDGGHDLTGPEIRLGLLAPLAGPRQSEGEALRRAAEMAVEEENATSLPGGRRLALVTRDEIGPWGQASAQIVHMVFDDQAVALITSTDGGAAHLAEQVANKIGVPILTLSSDTTTTEINLPWIFRMGPTDAMQAQAFARDIYQEKKLQRVALLTQNDHDSRVGSEEFEKAAREVNAPPPVRITVESENLSTDALETQLQGAQAVVIWADAATANLLVARVANALPSAPIYLCRKAAQGNWSAHGQPHCRACVSENTAVVSLGSGTGVPPVNGHGQDGRATANGTTTESGGIWATQAPDAPSSPHEAFAQRYRQRFGAEPGIGAAEAYDAVRVLAASLRQSGPNRARLRDALDQVSAFAGASGVISFDHAGNDLTRPTLVRLD